jgi:hypothetical protein
MKKIKNLSQILKLTLPIIILFFGLSGCSDNPVQQSSTTQSGSNNLQFSAIAVDNTTIPQNTMVLKEAKIMIKDMRIHMEGKNEEECENINVGPFVLNLKLNSTVNLISSSFSPAGTYDDVKFKIHKLGRNETVIDPDFSDMNGRYSVIVRGTYNQADFIFKSSVSVSQKLELPEKVLTSTNSNSNITLQAKPILWFMRMDNTILDPNNTFNREEIDRNIRNNIRESLRMFKDNDHNGHPDGGI